MSDIWAEQKELFIGLFWEKAFESHSVVKVNTLPLRYFALILFLSFIIVKNEMKLIFV